MTCSRILSKGPCMISTVRTVLRMVCRNRKNLRSLTSITATRCGPSGEHTEHRFARELRYTRRRGGGAFLFYHSSSFISLIGRLHSGLRDSYLSRAPIRVNETLNVLREFFADENPYEDLLKILREPLPLFAFPPGRGIKLKEMPLVNILFLTLSEVARSILHFLNFLPPAAVTLAVN